MAWTTRNDGHSINQLLVVLWPEIICHAMPKGTRGVWIDLKVIFGGLNNIEQICYSSHTKRSLIY